MASTLSRLAIKAVESLLEYHFQQQNLASSMTIVEPTPNAQFTADIATFKRILNASYLLGERSARRQPYNRRHRTPAVFRPRMDILDDPESLNYRATLELPGLKAEEIRLQLRSGHLCVFGERINRLTPSTKKDPSNSDSSVEQTEVEQASLYPVQEIRYGRFYRAIRLPPDNDPAQIKASMVDGMLTIEFPKGQKPSGAHNHESS